MPDISSMPIIDTDTHVTEPPDLWDRFLPSKWKDDPLRPHVEWDDKVGQDRWIVGGHPLTTVAYFAYAGWKEFAPAHPPSLEQADAGSWDPHVRLERMDEYGIWAQVLYPNIIAFQTFAFFDKQMSPQLSLDCVRAYNDFLVDFAAADPRRLVPIMMVPFWDLEATYAEIERAASIGHKGILFASRMELAGVPPLHDPHWSKMFSMAEEMGQSVNFHVGFSEMRGDDFVRRVSALGDEHSRLSSVSMLSNARAVADVICSGICHRHPDLKIVSVESGAAWLPYLAEALDWHWKSFGATIHRPDMELPSFYLRRQIYGTFWFESEVLARMADLLPDNIMFETDYPHPNSLSPGPASFAETPRATIERAVAGLDEALVRKLLYETAANVYQLDVPSTVAVA
jgi:predicted TIM-barrel fold metal-dependent hydrolase